MKTPLSWIKDFVDVDMPLNDLAGVLTMLGLEVEGIKLIGLPKPELERYETSFTGLSWDPDKIVVAQIDEVMPHPNADRLVLCKVQDGQQEHIVLTGAPNLFEYKGTGPLPKPLKIAYAKEGAEIYDGHQPGYKLVKLKKAKIRGVESYSMACSEKELGISDEHEGIIILDNDAPTGMPLVEYMGDAVFDIAITPNQIRNACMYGVARELAAYLKQPLKKPNIKPQMAGPSIEGQVSIEITDSEMNPRFLVGLIKNVKAKPSPYWVQRRLRLAGMRPINSIVDATNYVMLETAEPLHAFDYDVLVKRAGGKAPTIITRAAKNGEKLVTLDNIERTLKDYTIMVTDTAGSLSLAGVMGGLESEITEETENILLEGASWNFINVRKTVADIKLDSEAAYRFARGIHPSLAEPAVLQGLELMQAWSGGGEIAKGLVDNYPNPPIDPEVSITTADIKRHLGINLSAKEIAEILERIEFTCKIEGDTVKAQTPPIRLDINEGFVGVADLLEEISRHYGYNNIPHRRLPSELPNQKNRPELSKEEALQDVLVSMGLQEIINYRMTTPEKEAMLNAPGAEVETPEYVKLANPITVDRTVMRRNILAGMVEILDKNSRIRERLAMFEIGAVYIPRGSETLPEEPVRLAIGLHGKRSFPDWKVQQTGDMDFYDLKGVIEGMLKSMHINMNDISFTKGEHPALHPGKCAFLMWKEEVVGVFGELHPKVKERYDFGLEPVLLAEIYWSELLAAIPVLFDSQPVPLFPSILEDIAVIVDETTNAADVEKVIWQAGGSLLVDVKLFDVYTGDQVEKGKKSLAYNLSYQASDKTLTDKDAAKIRSKIVNQLERQLGATLRS